MAYFRRISVFSTLALLLVATAPLPSSGAEFSGTVIFARGDQVVGELSGEIPARQRLIVLGGDLRPKGSARVVRSLSPGTYLLAALDGSALAAGDRLAWETEQQAAARVFGSGRREDFLEFLESYPQSSYRPRVGRELFRLAMASSFPAEGGPVVTGRVRLAEETGREISLDAVPVILDRYQFPGTGPDGSFRVDGIPPLDVPAAVQIRIREPRLQMDAAVEVTLPADGSGEVAVDLPVRVTPTVLVGRIVDGRDNALPGAQVWTAPPSTETLSDDQGEYRISRRKVLAPDGAGADRPLFGEEFAVYAWRKGYGAGRQLVSAQSYRENVVPVLRLQPQDPRRDELPELGVDPRAHLWVSTLPHRRP